MPETARCNWCHRKSILVDRRSGWLMNHFKRSGRKGGHCPGSNRHLDSRPEVAA